MNQADLVLFSTAIFDSVADAPFSGGVAVRGGRIAAIGSKETITPYIGEHTLVRDFGDCLIMPGFFDGHVHYQTAAIREYGSCISYLEDCTSEQEVIEGVRAYLKEHPDCKRVHGRCWMHCSFGPGAPEPTKHSLDEAFPDLPVYLLSQTGHSCWLNSAAIEECHLEEIVQNHPEWSADYAKREPDGSFTGYITEEVSYTVRYMVEVYPAEEIEACDRKFHDLLNSYGITSVTDTTAVSPSAMLEYLAPMKQMENEGSLHLHFHQWCGGNLSGDVKHSFQASMNLLKALRTYMCSDKLRITGAKIGIDGVPDTHTAAMLEPYDDLPTTSGTMLLTPEEYNMVFTLANQMGFPVKCHCIGDRAVHTAIDAFEASAKVNDIQGLRNAVEHMNTITDEDIERMKKLNLIASIQPAHMVDWIRGCGELLYGHERNLRESRYRKLINSGLHYAIGTDMPVVSSNPLHTVYEAVTRKDSNGIMREPFTPEQAMTLAEALKGYTIGSAYANGVEDHLGTLEIGKYADFAVIDKNLFNIAPEEIDHCKNVCTIFEGTIVYEA